MGVHRSSQNEADCYFMTEVYLVTKYHKRNKKLEKILCPAHNIVLQCSYERVTEYKIAQAMTLDLLFTLSRMCMC